MLDRPLWSTALSGRENNMRPPVRRRSAFAHLTLYNDGMTKPDDASSAKNILKRIDDDQRSMIVQDGRGAQIDESDPVEVWAKRIGRLLGMAFLVVLVVNLFTGWFF
jgi:hypothetical protein